MRVMSVQKTLPHFRLIRPLVLLLMGIGAALPQAHAQESYVGLTFQIVSDPRPGKLIQLQFGPEVRYQDSGSNFQSGTALHFVVDSDGKILRSEFKPRLGFTKGLVQLTYEPGILIRIHGSSYTEKKGDEAPPSTVSWIQTDAWQPKVRGLTPSQVIEKAEDLKKEIEALSSTPSSEVEISPALLEAIQNGVQESLQRKLSPATPGACPPGN